MKKELYELKSLDEAIVMVTKRLEKIQRYISNIRQYYKKNLKVLTGAEGSISSKSLTSLKLILWAIKRLDKIKQVFYYKSTNMLSLMTLIVEHLHATLHIKQPLTPVCFGFYVNIKGIFQKIK